MIELEFYNCISKTLIIIFLYGPILYIIFRNEYFTKENVYAAAASGYEEVVPDIHPSTHRHLDSLHFINCNFNEWQLCRKALTSGNSLPKSP